jgi:hypothetical protein
MYNNLYKEILKYTKIPKMMKIFKNILDNVNSNWNNLSRNKFAGYLLEKNFDKIDWKNLSSNKSSIHILEKNFYNIDWYNLSGNSEAMSLLEKNIDFINWYNISPR